MSGDLLESGRSGVMASLSAFAIALLLLGCATPTIVTPPVADLKAARDLEMLTELRRLGRNGDWLVIRGYHATDHLVSTVTNTPWSHAAVLDMEKDEVIEAEGQGVHVTALPDFVAKSHRLLLVRPNWANDKSVADALTSARASLSKGYDFLGLVGINIPDRYYCSELAVAIYKPYIPNSQRIPRPVTPAQLHYWGRIIYDSGDP